MTTLSDAQIAQHAINAGFPSSEIPRAVAVALAESGGVVEVVHRNPNGSIDTGVWQINSIHGISSLSLQDPNTNAKAAHDIWAAAGNSWTPWTTYTSGAYLIYMGRGSAAAAHPDGSASASPLPLSDPNTSQGVSNTQAALDKITFGGFWLRVGAGILGTVLFVMAIMRMMGVNQTIVQFTKSAASKALEAAPEMAA